MAALSLLRGKFQYIYYRMMMPYWRSQFSPFIANVIIGDISFRFFYGTQLSRSWYLPIRPHAMAEYLWVQDNIDLTNQRIIDAGAHHGHYSSYFAALGGIVTAVEPLSANTALITVNAAINHFDIKIVESAVSDETGTSTFIPRSNGKIFKGVGITVPLRTLLEIDPAAAVVKLDIEGAEFRVLPAAIDLMPKARTWIIEAHAHAGNINALVSNFMDKGFEVNYLEKRTSKVKPFAAKEKLDRTTTIFCIKP